MKYILVFICCLLFTGCGFKDIDKRFFVVAVGIDKDKEKEENYLIHLKLAITTTEQKMGESNSIVVSESAETITEAVRIIKSRVDKELDFGHAKMILYGEDVVKEDIRNVLDWFLRRRDIQQIAWIGIGKPTAKDILELQPKSENIPGNALFLGFGYSGTETPYVASNYLFNFRRSLYERGISAYLPIVSVKDDLFNINTMALFEDFTMKHVLSKDETRILYALMSDISKVDIDIEEEEGFKFILTLDHVNKEYQIVTPVDRQPFIDMRISLEGIVEEATKELTRDEIEKLNKIASNVAEERVLSLLKKLQGKKLDPFGFGLRYRATHRGEESEKIEKWLSIYPNIDFRVSVDVNVEGTGVIE
ncbi:Ger(x)C family spore germination protein [Bacillus sp. HMF5848]|uniref:Ger(x)C family spore germination protein n=1 Tax=Bacillus sp. HMF5848 TaxID=2495421 RepID=UPI000F7ABE7E|nr:Ger(x)C family spore germination protein [Bacillus sp. HMF5848]RSK26219.1 Ger(x)C family spore germination protein [Bacillus sp. HMF5848]